MEDVDEAAMAVPMANDKGRDCLVWDVTKNVRWQWCLCLTGRWFFSFRC